MPGLYAVPTRGPGTLITALIYNGDHQIQVDSRSSIEMQSFSATAAQMLTSTDPFGPDHTTEVLPLSLGDELARLRFVIATIKTGLNNFASNWTDPMQSPAPATVGARVQRPTSQSITSGVTTAIDFTGGVAEFNTGVWEGVIHPTRFTAPSAGKYYAAGSVVFDAGTNSMRRIQIGVNGSFNNFLINSSSAGGSAVKQRVAVVGIVNLAANDYVEIGVRQDSGGALNILNDHNQSPIGALVFLGS